MKQKNQKRKSAKVSKKAEYALWSVPSKEWTKALKKAAVHNSLIARIDSITSFDLQLKNVSASEAEQLKAFEATVTSDALKFSVG